MSVTQGFVPPPYPYERLDDARAVAAQHSGGAVDCSIGAPCDAPSPHVIAALSASGSERGYPPSIGSPAFREAAAAWVENRLGVSLDPNTQLAACIGSKEFVVSLPHHLRLRRPDLDTVLYPAISYPSYAPDRVHPTLALRMGEVAWFVREEMARTVDDVLARRTRSLILDARAAIAAATEVARIMAGELGRDEDWAEEQVREFSEIAAAYVVE